MILPYLKAASRGLVRHKAYTAINLLGLTVGLAACLLILIFVRQELSYDDWIPDADRIYQVQSQLVAPDEVPAFQQTTFYPAAANLRKDFPQVEQAAGTWRTRPVVLRGGEPSFEDLLLAEPSLFDVLELPFAAGDRATALRSADSLVLTQEMAEKYFGRGNALGRTLTILRDDRKYDLRVTGVLKKLPPNTHLALSMIARISPSFFPDEPMALDAWNHIPGYVYVKLRPGADPGRINQALPAWEKRTIPVESVGKGQMSRADRWALHLENIRNIHTGRFQEGAMTPGTDLSTIYTFGVIGLLILGIACANFVNLATARAGQRAREVALRKLVGARRGNLVAQFLLESTILAVVALLLAFAAAELLLPSLAAFLRLDLHLRYLGPNGVLPPMLALTLLLGVVGGLYQAFYLSRFRPAEVLKSNKSSGDTRGSGRIRTILVVAQFAVSTILFICTGIVYAQTKHAQSVDPGYKRDGLLIVRNIGADKVLPLVDSLKREIARVPGVTGVARSSISPGSQHTSKASIEMPGRPNAIVIETYDVDVDFFRTMGMRMVAGRPFSEAYALDDATLAFSGDPAASARGVNVVVNSSAARQLGFKTAQSAIGGHFRIGDLPVEVVGIVGDVQFDTLRSETRPMIYHMGSSGESQLIVRFERRNPSEVLAGISRIWRQRIPEMPLDAVFAEEALAKLYEAEASGADEPAGMKADPVAERVEPVAHQPPGDRPGDQTATIIGHALRVARQNPIYALRYE